MRFLPYRPLPFSLGIGGQIGRRRGALAIPKLLRKLNFSISTGKIGSPKNKLPLPAPEFSSVF